MKISNQFTEQNHKGFIEIFQFQLFQLCPRHKSGGDGMKGAGARVCPRTGVQRWLRVNSNASLPGAQWSTLYPCMRGQQHDGGREGGGQREGRRAHQDKGEERTEDRTGSASLCHDKCDLCCQSRVSASHTHLSCVWCPAQGKAGGAESSRQPRQGWECLCSKRL